jgi:hypothetical protein
MAILGEVLFYRRDQVDLDTVLRHQEQLLREKVEKLPSGIFSAKSDGEIAADMAASEAIAPLQIDLQRATPQVLEVQLNIRDQFGFDRELIRVPGLRATKTIPFTGDPTLWHLRTNPYNLNPPHGEVRGSNLIIGVEVPAQQANEAKQYIDETIAKLPEYLERQRAQIEPYNNGIAGNAVALIVQRRSRLSQASDLLNKLR